MRQRDRQNELVVAVIVVGALALALTFGVILAVSTGNGDPAEPSATAETRPVNLDSSFTPENIRAGTPDGFPTEQRLTPTPSASITETVRNTFTRTPTASVTVTATRRKSSETPTKTILPSTTATNSPSPSREISVSVTPRKNTNTPTLTSTASSMRSVTRTLTATRTSTNTATPTAPKEPTRTDVLRTPSRTALSTVTATITPFPSPTGEVNSLSPTPLCKPRADWIPYVVQIGDTLFEIALATGISTNELRAGNCITGNRIDAGQILLIPASMPRSEIVPPEGCDIPSVRITSPRIGDTLRGTFLVRGIADHPEFGSYSLDLKHAGGAPDYHTLSTYTQRAATESDLGYITILPTYPPDLYWIRLTVYDRYTYTIAHCAIRVRFEQ